MSEPLDIGFGVTIRFYSAEGYIGHCGIIEEHPTLGKTEDCHSRCSGAIHFRGRPGASDEQPTWEVVSEEPLTLSPAIVCRKCGHNGRITDGKWVPA